MAVTIANVNTEGVITDRKVPIRISGDTIAASTRITDDIVVMTQIYWYSPDAVNDLAALQDKDGNELFPMHAVVASQGLLFGPIRIPANGIYMDNLDSGEIYIYLENL